MEISKKKLMALLLGVFLFGGAAGFFVGYPVGEDRGAGRMTLEGGSGGMEMTSGEVHGISLATETIPEAEYEDYGIMPIAESAKRVTATVEPQESDVKLDWSVAWKDGTSTFASGKR